MRSKAARREAGGFGPGSLRGAVSLKRDHSIPRRARLCSGYGVSGVVLNRVSAAGQQREVVGVDDLGALDEPGPGTLRIAAPKLVESWPASGGGQSRGRRGGVRHS